MDQPKPTARLHIGAAYYPEQWPESRWPADIGLMRAAGLTVARMGEFAWSAMEPAAGAFDFGWLERAIEQLAAVGLVTVLGTPTAVPPAWLVQQFPDLMAVDDSGRRVPFGDRCHYCVNSPDLAEAIARLVAALAEHFGANPNVIGWQIDNEYNRVCYCDRCEGLFQAYLARTYGSLEALNKHWSTRYWSQTYSDWRQISIPNPSFLSGSGLHNPGLMLAFKHFVTESYRQFQRRQIDLLRPHLGPETWITHNFMGWFDGFDHYALSEDLDFVSWDWYTGTGHHDHTTSGATHDLTRGFKRRNFWLMETQPGNVNWAHINNSLHQGEARAMAWHAVAHGAEAVLYWQWRSAPGGQEQYHGTLVDQSGAPRPFYAEARQVAADFAAASPLLSGSTPTSEVALLNSYDDRWAIHWQRHHRDFDYVAHFIHYYRPLAVRNASADVVPSNAPLAGYKLIIAPSLHILTNATAERLAAYVAGGGHLVLTIRSGMKNVHNALLPSRQPGILAALAGAEVEDYYALLEPAPVIGEGFSGASRQWAERLRVLDPVNTRVLARYGTSNGWLDGQPAITVRDHGAGRVYLAGAYLDAEAQQVLMDEVLQAAGVEPALQTPAGVEARWRATDDGPAALIVINHTRSPQSVLLPWPAREHLAGRSLDGVLELAPYGVAVLSPEDVAA
jgi:beta-galactosidase